MSQDTWTAVDSYFEALLHPADPALDAALVASEAADLPEIQVAPNQGKLLMLLAQMVGAKRILEIGTLGGYSTIWLARALPEDGRLITLEYEPKHAEVARKNIANAGFADKVTIHVGKAVDNLPELADDAPFDFIFIDADKPSNPDYFEWSLKYSRVGTVIFLDNVVRQGMVVDADSDNAAVQGVRAVIPMIADEPRVEAMALQTVGSKGYDGFSLIHVIST